MRAGDRGLPCRGRGRSRCVRPRRARRRRAGQLALNHAGHQQSAPRTERLPTALVGASGVTCWRRLIEWREAGVRQQLHERLLAELRAAGLLDLSTALVDSTHLRA